jgi:hypothetical protein
MICKENSEAIFLTLLFTSRARVEPYNRYSPHFAQAAPQPRFSGADAHTLLLRSRHHPRDARKLPSSRPKYSAASLPCIQPRGASPAAPRLASEKRRRRAPPPASRRRAPRCWLPERTKITFTRCARRRPPWLAGCGMPAVPGCIPFSAPAAPQHKQNEAACPGNAPVRVARSRSRGPRPQPRCRRWLLPFLSLPNVSHVSCSSPARSPFD